MPGIVAFKEKLPLMFKLSHSNMKEMTLYAGNSQAFDKWINALGDAVTLRSESSSSLVEKATKSVNSCSIERISAMEDIKAELLSRFTLSAKAEVTTELPEVDVSHLR